MKRKDVVREMMNRGYTRREADMAVGDMLNIIMEALADGKEVQFYGFGTFFVKNVADKETVDLVTRERIVVPGHKIPRFTPSATMRKAVREGVLRT